ncbi:MAG: NADP oxidoreductase [Nitrososphaerota archaeon]|nr:NADP oxidoreductase [Nitrososphaerota archaeon]
MNPKKLRVATVWLSGCSGCHMSFLDQDEQLLELAKQITLVYSPLIDAKEFPPDVALTLIEGAVANEEQKEMLKTVRAKTITLVSLGDCAVTGNVVALRNRWPQSDQAIIDRAYNDPTNLHPQTPQQVPKLLSQVQPLHEIVKVDHYIPGCPPNAKLINYVLTELIAGRIPLREEHAKYG